MAKKTSTKNKDILKGTNAADVLTVKHTQVTVNAGKGNDKINVNGGSSHKIYGEAGNDTIIVAAKAGSGSKFYGDDAKGKVTGNDTFKINGGKKNYFYGGKGVDTFNVNGGTTNYIYGGVGNDVIVIGKNSKGKAVVKDFSVKKGNTDKVKVVGGAVKNIAVSGKNMIIKGGKSASLTLQKAKNKTFTVTDTLGKYTVTGANVKLALGKSYKGTLTAASFITTVDARSDANAISIDGNAKNNTIYGGAGNNILNGGGGNDTLVGGGGKDTFVYANGGGNDTITDYEAGQDTLQISSGSISKTSHANSNKDLVFAVGNGNITLKNAATNAVSLKDSRGSYTASNTAIALGSDFAGTMDANNYLATVTTLDGRNVTKALTITGNAQDNTIYAGRSGGTIDGMAGDDTLYGGAGNDILNGGSGNDTLVAGAGDDTLYGGAGQDTFVYANGDGNDIVQDYAAEQDTLQISSGTISQTELANSNKDLVFTVGAGTVTLTNAATETIRLKDDRGSYIASNTAITLGEDFAGEMDANAYLATVTTIDGRNAEGIVNITGNAQDNVIYAGKSGGMIDGGVGDDIIYGGAGKDTLTGGTGKDTFVYANGEGSDTITDYISGQDTLQISSGSISKTVLTNSDKDLLFRIGDYNITLKNAATEAIGLKDSRGSYTASGTAITLGSDFAGTIDANNYLATVATIDGRNASKTLNIIGNAQDNTIYAGKFGGTIYGGAGDDTLYGDNENDKLTGGNGNDKLYGGAGNDTLRGGGGNDMLTGGAGNDTFVYANGGGNDTITDYVVGQDTLQISGGTINKATLSNSNKDLIFKVGSGTVTLTGAATKAVSLKDSRGSYSASVATITLGEDFAGEMDANAYLTTVTTIDGRNSEGSVNITGNAQDNVIYAGKSGGTIDGGAGDDTLTGGNGDDTLIGGAGNDTFIYANGQGNDTITDYVAGQDTLQITNGLLSRTEQANSNKDLVFTVGAGTVTLSNAASEEISLKDDRGSYTVSGTAITLGSDFTGTIDANNYLATVATLDGRNTTRTLNITGNAQDNIIYAGKSGGTINGSTGDDTLYGGAGNDTLTGGAGNDMFVYANGEGNDTITDYTAGQDTLFISSGSITETSRANSYKDLVFTVGSGKVTLTGAATRKISLKDSRGSYTVSDSAITLGSDFTGDMDANSYLPFISKIDGSNAEGIVNITGNSNTNVIYAGKSGGTIDGGEAKDYLYGGDAKDYLYGGEGDDTLDGGADNDTLYGGEGNDTLDGGAGNDTLYGGEGNDTLDGGAGNDTLYGGEGDDTLVGGIGNDTLVGGAGNDTFVYANGQGNDTITDYVAGQDSLQISSGTISQTGLANNNKDLVFTVGTGTVTLSNAASKAISLKDSRGSYTASGTAITLGSDFTGTIDANNYLTTVTTIDGRNAKQVSITGNALDNVIYSGKYPYCTIDGGAGDDTLYGGSSSDTLIGGSGNDTFVYADGSGYDTIRDYTEGQDTLQISSGSISKAKLTNSNRDLVFTVGTGAVNLSNAASKKISLKDSRGSYTASNTAITLGTDFAGEMDANVYLSTVTTIDGRNVGGIVNITGNAQNNIIYAGKSGGTIDGGAGNDTLYGGAGDDMLTGGAGNDTFVYANGGGNDTITDYTEGLDTLQISSGMISQTELANNNKDLVFTVGTGTVTLGNAASKTISLKDSRGSYTVSNTAITLDADFAGEIDANVYLSTITTIDGRNAESIVNITGNAQDNVIYAGKSGGTIDGGAGNDTLYGGAGDDTLNGGSGRDRFWFTEVSNGVNTINDYQVGVDTIVLNDGVVISQSTVSGTDVVLTLSTGGTINIVGATGKDIAFEDNNGNITHETFDSIIYGTDDNDELYGTTNADFIYGKAGDDYIEGLSNNDSLYGGIGNDSITGGAGNDTLDGGAGNDTLTGGEGQDTFVYANGEGNDTITDYTEEQDTLQISNGIISQTELANSNKDLVFTVGSGKVTLTGAATKTVSLKDGRGSYTVSNTAITLGADFAGEMDASAYLTTVITIDGRNAEGIVNITGNSQDNIIYAGKSGGTIDGRAGNDILTGGAGQDTFVYANGDGNDIVQDYAAEQDTLQISSGTISQTELTNSNKDLVFTVGAGTVTLTNAATETISLQDERGNYTASNTAITLGTDFAGEMDANAYLSTVTTIDGRNAEGIVNITGNAQDNIIYAGKSGGTIDGGAGNDTLTGGAGQDTFVYANEQGNDSITDYTAGQDILQISTGTISKTELTNSNKDLVFTVGAGTVTLTNAATETIRLKDRRGSYTASGTAITLGSDFTGTIDANNYLATIMTLDGRNATSALNITANAQDNVIYAGKFGGTIYGGAGDDTLYGGDGDDTLYGGSGQDTFVHANGGGNDVIKDYTKGQDTLKITDGFVSNIVITDDKMVLTVGDGSVTLEGATNVILQLEDVRGSYTVSGTAIMLDSDFAGEMDANAYLSTVTTIDGRNAEGIVNITGNAQDNIIYAGKSGSMLYGGDGDDTLYGGAGNDILNGGTGNDMLTGGTGNDMFMYASGQDIITDYMAGQDTLQISSGTISQTELANSNKDLVFTVGAGTVTLTNAATETIRLKDDRGSYIASNTAITLGEDFAGEMDTNVYLSTVTTIDGRNAEGIVNITGNTQDNIIYAGKSGGTADGGTGDDTLTGGAGDDTLTGGEGQDTFMYANGQGNDTITDYTEEQDTLQIYSGIISKTELANSNKDLVFTVGSGKVTLTEAATKTISLKDRRGNYTVSNTAIILGADFAGEMDANTYLSTVTTIDGRNAEAIVNITGNSQDNIIYAGKSGGTIDGGIGNDTLTGGAGQDTFVYANSDGNDIVQDYAAEQDTLQISSGTISQTELANSNKDLVFTVGVGTVTLTNAATETIRLKDRRGSYTASGTAITLGSDFTGTIDTNNYLSTVTAIDGRNAEGIVNITGNSQDNIIYAGKSGGTIDGGAGDDTLYGGAGNDTLIGGTGNNTLYGGAGNDMFVYANSGGNDTITDYTAGQDTLKITGGYVSSIEITDDKTVLVVGEGGVTLHGVTVGTLQLEDDRGSYTASNTTITLGADFAGEMDANAYLSTVTTIDGRNAEGIVNITGNTQDNVIYAGKSGGTVDGGAGNDTLYGGAGDDTLYGGTGQDTFVYANGGGNDIIKDYTKGQDTLQITDGFVSNIEITDDKTVLTIGEGSVTLEGITDETWQLQDARGGYTVNKTAITLDPDFKGTMDAGAFCTTATTIDGRSVVGAVNITGNARANTIYAGKVGGIINGGGGNDTLYGGEGYDTFVFSAGDGNDTIKNYQEEDIIKIEGEFIWKIDSTYNSVTNTYTRVLNFGEYYNSKGTVTVETAKGQTLHLRDSRGSYSISDTMIKLGKDFSGSLNSRENFLVDLSGIQMIDAGDVENSIYLSIGGNPDGIIMFAGKAGGTYHTFTPGNDYLYGGDGDDSLYIGVGGSDYVYGGKGNDYICWCGDNSDEDYLYGGDGDDTFAFVGRPIATIEDYGNGNDLIKFTGSYPTVEQSYVFQKDLKLVLSDGRSIVTITDGAYKDVTYEDAEGNKTTIVAPKLVGTAGDDSLIGDDDTHLIYGGAGNDIIKAGAGYDRLYGGDGNDWIHGGKGDDILYGEAGNDYLYGEGGNNTLYGGEGDDHLKGWSAIETVNNYYPGSGNDYIDCLMTPGKDNIWYESGNDTIEGYWPDDDIVYLMNTTLVEVTSGEHGESVYNLSNNGTIRVDGGGGSGGRVYFVDCNGNQFVIYDSYRGPVSLYNSNNISSNEINSSSMMNYCSTSVAASIANNALLSFDNSSMVGTTSLQTMSLTQDDNKPMVLATGNV